MFADFAPKSCLFFHFTEVNNIGCNPSHDANYALQRGRTAKYISVNKSAHEGLRICPRVDHSQVLIDPFYHQTRLALN